jgi:hypothetical protein
MTPFQQAAALGLIDDNTANSDDITKLHFANYAERAKYMAEHGLA